MEKIYDTTKVNMLLGCLLQDTSLITNDKYPLCKDDFVGHAFDNVMYVSIVNLSRSGYKTISFFDLDKYLQKHEAQYQIFKDCRDKGDVEDFLDTIVYLGKLENYESYYNDVRKLSCIRDYRDSGYDIEKFWDYNKSETDNIKGLEGIKIEEIVNYFEGLQTQIKRKYKGKKVKEEYVAGTDFMETKERFKESPLLGNSFQSEYLNGIFRGMFGFIIRTAKSGGGKSVLSLGDLCQTCILEYWDFDQNKFAKNESRVGNAMFLNTELELREQLDVATIAWISGVERDHIIDGEYLEGEEDRVDYANEVLSKSGLYFVDDPEFTCSSLEDTIRDYVYNKQCKTICFDYISDNNYVGKEIAQETKIPQRQDMILLELTARLKQVQRETGCCLISACQTNGNEDSMDYPTSACMAGGKSQERKTDGVLFMLPPTKKELESVAPLIAKLDKGNGIKINMYPNNVCHIVKGRNSKYEKHTKVFQYIDLGTLRTVDLFCTNKRNEPIKVEALKIVANN